MSDSHRTITNVMCRKTNWSSIGHFALGAVIMMRLAGIAAQYFPDVEIIELHHDQKIDAPSGTSLGTADVILAAQSKNQQVKITVLKS